MRTKTVVWMERKLFMARRTLNKRVFSNVRIPGCSYCVRRISQLFADIIWTRHETLGLRGQQYWPPVFIHRFPNCKNCSFLRKFMAPCVRTVGHRRNISDGSWCLNLGILACTPGDGRLHFFADRTSSNTPSVLVAVHFTKYAEHFRWNRTIYTAM